MFAKIACALLSASPNVSPTLSHSHLCASGGWHEEEEGWEDNERLGLLYEVRSFTFTLHPLGSQAQRFEF